MNILRASLKLTMGPCMDQADDQRLAVDHEIPSLSRNGKFLYGEMSKTTIPYHVMANFGTGFCIHC